MRILGHLDTPAGVLSVLDKISADRGPTRAQLLARAGVTQSDWDALSTALSSANGANLLKLLNSATAMLVVIESPIGFETAAVAKSNGASVSTLYGSF
jgi:hypothetical protein